MSEPAQARSSPPSWRPPGVMSPVGRVGRAPHGLPTVTEMDLPTGRVGVLPSQRLLAAIDAGVIDGGGFTIPPENVQPASLDLRLGEVAYRIRCSFLPDKQTVDRKVKDYIID